MFAVIYRAYLKEGKENEYNRASWRAGIMSTSSRRWNMVGLFPLA